MTAARDAEVVARTAFARDWNVLAHTVRVVENLGSDATDEELAVAWLHDVVEDSEVAPVDLSDIGFSSDVVHAVQLLSRSYGSDYGAYKRALLDAPGEAGRLARKVKLADARENLARCEAARGIPKWQRLAESRYRPLIAALEGFGDRQRG